MPSPDETPPPTVRAGRVTALRPTKRDPDRIAVDLDGSFAFALPATLVGDERIEIGDLLDVDRVTALLAADQASRATEAALVFLSYRPRSEKEVRDRLRRGGYEPDAIEHAIGRLHEWRYLDDADFARRWVENRTAHRPRGKRLLQQELRHKGIDGEIARDAIDDADLDETGAAEALARRRLPSYAGDDPAAIRRRLGAYLARRGYGYDVIRIALDRALGEGKTRVMGCWGDTRCGRGDGAELASLAVAGDRATATYSPVTLTPRHPATRQHITSSPPTVVY